MPILEGRGIKLSWSDVVPHTRGSSLLLPSTATVVAKGAHRSTMLSRSRPQCYLGFERYRELCASVTQVLVEEENFASVWLSRGHCMPRVLHFGLVAGSWDRWALVYDPEGHARAWLQSLHNNNNNSDDNNHVHNKRETQCDGDGGGDGGDGDGGDSGGGDGDGLVVLDASRRCVCVCVRVCVCVCMCVPEI